MTYQEAAQAALDVQNAVNLSGVARSFSLAVSAIWDEAHRTGKGTAWVNAHPVVYLFLHKLTDLNGTAEFAAADSYSEVARIAAGDRERLDLLEDHVRFDID